MDAPRDDAPAGSELPSGDTSEDESERPPPIRRTIPPSIPLGIGPDLFLNRELSWLEFNQRVLDEAADPSVPLLERLKFMTIASSNLDEFFMVRVAGLLDQRSEPTTEMPADGMIPAQQLAAIAARTRRMLDDLAALTRDQLLPELAVAGVRLVKPHELELREREYLRNHFREQVHPVLTPLAIDPGHPFPQVRNRSVNLIAMLSGARQRYVAPSFAVVQVPGVLKRLVPVPNTTSFVLLDDIIAGHMEELFPGFRCLGAWPFRLIRNSDLSVDEEEAEDLLESLKAEVRRRRIGNAVCLTLAAGADAAAVEMLQSSLEVDRAFVFPIDGPQSIADLSALAAPLESRKDLRDEPFTPARLPPFRDEVDVFDAISRGDQLLHHPYESFDPVTQFVATAAEDPNVLAIKQTLYRTSGDSPIVKALIRAAEAGKEVTALVEIKARFDEENNIQWARTLENAGVHVVYGLLGLKTHCKLSLVVRREARPGGEPGNAGDRLRRYVHLGTGNYNPHTAGIYTDLSFFTARSEFGDDATALFNLLTSCTAPPGWKRLVVAPLGLHERVLGLIERECAFARAGRRARIVAKMNALVDPDVILALYRASQAGVDVDLLVRGICCLRPGIPGVSERIRVRSIVDRFLEHSRIFLFEAGGTREVYASSADWMPRNFHRRVEVMFPIEDEQLKSRIESEILGVSLADDVKARELRSDGSMVRVGDGTGTCRSQRRFLVLCQEAVKRAERIARRERPFVVAPVRNRPTNEPEPRPTRLPGPGTPGTPTDPTPTG